MRLFFIVFSILFADIRLSWAGGGEIFVSLQSDCALRKEYLPNISLSSEYPQYLISPIDLIKEYQSFFKNHESQYSGILNHGAIRFCGEKEKEIIYSFFIEQLKTKKPKQVVWEALLQQYRSDTFFRLVEKNLAETREVYFQEHLIKLQEQMKKLRKLSSPPANL